MLNRFRLLLAASLLAGSCLPARAQNAPPPAPAAPPADAAATAPLTLDDCIRRALAHGFDIGIQRFNPAIAQDFIEIARGGFLPILSLAGTQSHANTAAIGLIPGTRSDERSARLGLTELLKTGATVSVSTSLDRSANNPALISSLYNPAYNADLSVSISQPLLRGAGVAITTAALNRAKIGFELAGFNFKARVLDIVQRTENAYYTLVYARQQLDVYKFSLHLAETLLDEAQVRKTTGVATEIDVLQAQVGVANARRNVLQAGESVQDSADALLAIIGQFELDAPLGAAKFDDFTGQLPVTESSYQLALRNQPDYLSSRRQLDQLQLDVDVAKNAVKPSLSVGGAVGFNGDKGSGYSAFSSAASRDNNNWQLNLTASYPWGAVSDKARYRQSFATLNQQTLVVRQLEQSILVQVRSAVRAVETNSENVKIAALGAEYSAKQYDLERARFDAGLSTSRNVLQTQADLETARVAELQARINLQNSISALHRLEGNALERYQIAMPE